MAVTVVEVQGAARLRRTLKDAGDDLSNLRAAHTQAATIAAHAARQRAPRLTGALAGSIRPGATTTSAIIRAGWARLPYAGPIHWGWPARHIIGQPFLTDGAQASEPAWLPAYLHHITTTINHVQGA